MEHHITSAMKWADYRKIIRVSLVMLIDLIIVGFSYYAAFLFRFYFEPFLNIIPVTKGYPSLEIYLPALPVILFMWALAINSQGAYRRINIQALDELIRVVRLTMVATILSMSAMFLYHEATFSRLVFVLGGLIGGLAFYVERQLLKIAYIISVRRSGKPSRVLIVGANRLSTSIEKILERQRDRAIIKRGDMDLASIKKTIMRSRIGEVFLAHPDLTHKQMVDLAGYCEERGIVCRIMPDILEIRMGEVLIDDSLGIPSFQLKPVSLQGLSFLTKRIMDVSASALIIGLFFMPLALIAFLIKVTSKGTIFHKHERLGYRSRPFDFMKFRSMVHNAEELLAKLKEKSDRKGPVFKMKNDPRITPVGRFIRRYSLDELPQVINVLKGEMSLVGPRPQVLWETQAYDEWARKRLNVLPGITGLWQVSGRAELTYEEMIDLDIFYIEHWSPGLDIKILVKTIPAIFMAHGAY